MADFAKIRARAAKRKGGDAVLQSLLGAMPDNAAIANVPDSRILSTIAERVFAAGFVWRVIEQKWPGFEEAFLGFEPKRLLFQPDDFWHALASDKRIVRNPQKIRSVRDNAVFVERVSKEHGALASWPAGPPPTRLADGLSRQARQPARRHTAIHSWLGWDCFILSNTVLALRVAGLEIGDKPESKRDLAVIQDQLNRRDKETGLPRRHISRILAMSIGENHSADELRTYMGE